MAILYSNGQVVQIGDLVDFDGTPGTVLEIIETVEEQSASGLSTPFVFFDTEQYGQLLQSPLDAGWDGVIPFVQRPA